MHNQHGDQPTDRPDNCIKIIIICHSHCLGSLNNYSEGWRGCFFFCSQWGFNSIRRGNQCGTVMMHSELVSEIGNGWTVEGQLGEQIRKIKHFLPWRFYCNAKNEHPSDGVKPVGRWDKTDEWLVGRTFLKLFYKISMFHISHAVCVLRGNFNFHRKSLRLFVPYCMASTTKKRNIRDNDATTT